MKKKYVTLHLSERIHCWRHFAALLRKEAASGGEEEEEEESARRLDVFR